MAFFSAQECAPAVAKIKAAMKKRRVTGISLARELEPRVSRNTIYSVLRGERGTDSANLDLIAKAVRTASPGDVRYVTRSVNR